MPQPTDPKELVVPLAGLDWWNVAASGDVPALKVTDGPSGARGDRFAGGPASVSFPCPAALGASWDADLVERVGRALAVETRAKGAQVLLAPTVNLQRTPLGGRHFECLSEDPVLSAHLAVAYVTGLQGAGVAACVKHLVANDQEADRFEISSEPDERTLRECSLLPFEHALRRAGAWSTMAAYNRLHGTHCSEHPRLLTTILRDEWGWDGVVISDWFATRSTAASANAGLDLEITPLTKNQENVSKLVPGLFYWEGAVRVSGGQTGRGFVELTGYGPSSAGPDAPCFAASPLVGRPCGGSVLKPALGEQ